MERKNSRTINNSFYDDLWEDWNSRKDHPIALLRAENAVRNPWIAEEIEERLGVHKIVLDIGCGGGLLTNYLAKVGHKVTGIDLSESSLRIARQGDSTQNVHYACANAYCLPFENGAFDVVAAMDVLEHVEEPSLLLAEASRVLKPNGLFFFHTFNRNLLSYFLVIKGVDWFIPNAPRNMHVYPLFIKPDELEEQCRHYQMNVVEWKGLEPNLFSKSSFEILFKRRVPETFTFRFSRSLKTGYCGLAVKTK